MKYALVFACLGLVLVGQTVQAESWWVAGLLCWGALAFVLVALAYATGRVGIFGKRSDGRVAWWSMVVLLPYRLVAHLLWWLAVRWSREPAWQQIDGGLVVGRRLMAQEVPPGIDHVLDLTCEFVESAPLRRLDYRCLPLLDARADDPAAIRAMVETVAELPGTLFIHCAQGHGRTGLVAALVLARRTGLTSAEALARLQEIRPGIGLSPQQQAMLGLAQAG